MKLNFNLSQNSKLLLSNILKIYLPSVLFIILIWCISKIFGISMAQLTTDPAAGRAPYTGLITNIGNLLWCSTSAICIFSAFLTKLDPSSRRKWFNFLMISFTITTILLLDDMFQVHEYYPVLFFGIDAKLSQENRMLQNLLEGVLFIVYFICFTFYIFYFRKHLQRTEYIYLVLAFLFFGLSVVVDMTPENLRGHYIIEEGFKLLGIISWLTYFARTCSFVIRRLISNLTAHPEQA